MSTHRDRIVELLEDETRSFRAIGRELGVSDWLVRKTARELYADPRPMKQRPSRSYEPSASGFSPLAAWLVTGSVIGCLALAIWTGVRRASPLDPRDFSSEFHPNSPQDRTDNET